MEHVHNIYLNLFFLIYFWFSIVLNLVGSIRLMIFIVYFFDQNKEYKKYSLIKYEPEYDGKYNVYMTQSGGVQNETNALEVRWFNYHKDIKKTCYFIVNIDFLTLLSL